MDSRINFSDPELNRAASEAEESLSVLTSVLDQVSSDIKRLEAWLHEQGLCVPVSLHIRTKEFIADSGMVISKKSEYLKWSKVEGRWRLAYCSWTLPISYADDPHGQERPLIEMPAEVRLECRRALPSFVREVGRSLPNRLPDSLKFEA